jgi:hypothetical protein
VAFSHKKYLFCFIGHVGDTFVNVLFEFTVARFKVVTPGFDVESDFANVPIGVFDHISIQSFIREKPF